MHDNTKQAPNHVLLHLTCLTPSTTAFHFESRLTCSGSYKSDTCLLVGQMPVLQLLQLRLVFLLHTFSTVCQKVLSGAFCSTISVSGEHQTLPVILGNFVKLWVTVTWKTSTKLHQPDSDWTRDVRGHSLSLPASKCDANPIIKALHPHLSLGAHSPKITGAEGVCAFLSFICKIALAYVEIGVIHCRMRSCTLYCTVRSHLQYNLIQFQCLT